MATKHEKAKRAARRLSTAVRAAYRQEIALLNRLAHEAREAGDRAQAVGFDTGAYVMALRLRNNLAIAPMRDLAPVKRVAHYSTPKAELLTSEQAAEMRASIGW